MHAAERLQPRRLLQPRPVRDLRRRRARRRLDLDRPRHHRRRPHPGQHGTAGAARGGRGHGRRRGARPGPGADGPAARAPGLVQRRRARRRRRRADPADARHPRGRAGTADLPRAAPGVRRHPERRGGRGRGRRGALPQRPGRHAAVVTTCHDDPARRRDLRLGRRSAAGPAATGGHPALRRLLHGARSLLAGGRLALRRVRGRARRSAHAGPHRPYGPLAGRGVAVGGLPRPDPAAPPGVGLPRRDPDGPPHALRVDLAGDRGRHRGHPRDAMYLGHPVDQVVAELDAATRPLFARGGTP